MLTISEIRGIKLIKERRKVRELKSILKKVEKTCAGKILLKEIPEWVEYVKNKGK